MKSKIILYLLSFLVLLNTSAIPITPIKSLSDQGFRDIQIERESDGTSVITFDENQDYGFKFSTPNDWYPMTTPSTPDEIGKFKKVIIENDLRINEEELSRLTIEDEKLEMIIFDMNPEHIQGNGKSAVFVGNFAIPEIIPDWSIFLIKGLELDEIKKVNVENKDNQQTGIVEFILPLDDDAFLYGKMILFIRGGKMIVIAGVTDNDEWQPDVNNLIDSMFDSLDFDLKN